MRAKLGAKESIVYSSKHYTSSAAAVRANKQRKYILLGGVLFLFAIVYASFGQGSSSSTKRAGVTTQLAAAASSFVNRGGESNDWETRKEKIHYVLSVRDNALERHMLHDYTRMGDVSTSKVDDQIKAYSNWAAFPWVKTICEIGFAIGTSTITYLESSGPDTRIITFDTMELQNNASVRAMEFIQERYGEHRITLVKGYSQETVPSKQKVFAGLCDIISVDGLHDMTAYTDMVNFRPLANPKHHVLLADDCVPDEIYERVKTYEPNTGYFPEVWDSWRKLIDDDKIVKAIGKGYYIHGGEEKPVLESYSGYVKGWCEGEYIIIEATSEK